MKRRSLHPEERELWAKVAATVTPRPGRIVPKTDENSHDKASGAGRRPGPAPKPRAAPPGIARFAFEAQRQAPLERANDRRVRRGRLDIDGRLDLHGLTQHEARAALVSFLSRLRMNGGRCGLVITGKGREAGTGLDRPVGGVLRRALPEWLAAADIAPTVSGYAQAHRRHGGEGAWYVFVRRLGD